jgi:hypothetical protein
MLQDDMQGTGPKLCVYIQVGYADKLIHFRSTGVRDNRSWRFKSAIYQGKRLSVCQSLPLSALVSEGQLGV